MQQKQRLRKLLTRTAIVAAGGLLLVVFYRLFGFGIPCFFHAITGLYCAGCGAMRAIVSLAHLQFYKAFRYNALFVVLLPFLAAFLVLDAIRFLRGKPCKIGWISWVFIILLSIAAVAFTIARNLPQFAFLAPTVVG